MNDDSKKRAVKLNLKTVTENEKGIENHKKAAFHFLSAANCHIEAAKLHEMGAHDQAARITIEALGHSISAGEAQILDFKHHTPRS
jgi:hypothetical protein